MSRYIINELSVDDLEDVLKIEKEVELSPWSRESFLFELLNNKNALYLAVRSKKGDLTGFAGAWIFKDEAHIATMSVSKSFRGLGLGSLLLYRLIEICRERGCYWITLEVWEKNKPAIALYTKFGFVRAGFRKNYYDLNRNALIMWAGSLKNKSYNERLKKLNKQLKK
ncbi:MAG: ribosomal protein S18-alanine N-acetyltransferase [Chloroflexi bacterium]|nr:ribosomal protein S18-alanine N-acetyltransferase [Chloroflexota bacterium]